MIRYLDDWKVGETFVTRGRTIGESDVSAFAALTWDVHPNHTDAQAMEKSVFGERIAHGLFGIAIAHGLLMQLGIVTNNSIALLSVDNWTFKKPIFFGDTVHVKITVDDIKFSRSKNDRGVMKLYFEVINQKDEVCQVGYKSLMMKREIA